MRSLDAIVSDNRFTIAVVFPLAGAALLLASSASLLQFAYAGVSLSLNFNPYMILFGTIIMRLPLISGIKPLLSKRAAVGLALVTVYAFVIELIGVKTGFPYGSFQYQIELGPMLLGDVPLGLPVFFLPLVLNSYLLVLLLGGERVMKRRVRLPVVILTVIAMDIVLDPAAVALGFWQYTGGGVLHGVPLSNYAGWTLSATVATLVFDFTFDVPALRDRLETCEYMLDDVISFVILWGIVNLVFLNALSIIVTGLFIGLLVWSGQFNFPSR